MQVVKQQALLVEAKKKMVEALIPIFQNEIQGLLEFNKGYIIESVEVKNLSFEDEDCSTAIHVSTVYIDGEIEVKLKSGKSFTINFYSFGIGTVADKELENEKNLDWEVNPEEYLNEEDVYDIADTLSGIYHKAIESPSRLEV